VFSRIFAELAGKAAKPGVIIIDVTHLKALRIVRPSTDNANHGPVHVQHLAGTTQAHLEGLLEISNLLPPVTGR
jgi:hypothetical protein